MVSSVNKHSFDVRGLLCFFDVCLDLIYVIDIFPHSSGCYPHPDVPAVPKLRPVQKEVVYCPDLRFMAYDIAVIHQSSTQSEAEHDRRECIVEPVLMATLKKGQASTSQMNC